MSRSCSSSDTLVSRVKPPDYQAEAEAEAEVDHYEDQSEDGAGSSSPVR